MRGAEPLVLLQQELGQTAVECHAVDQPGHTDVTGQHGSTEHQRGVDGNQELQPAAGGHIAQVGQQVVLVEAHLLHGKNRQCQEGHGRIENRDGDPHVPQRLGKDSRFLFFNEVCGTLEPRDSQHRSTEPEEQRHKQARLRQHRQLSFVASGLLLITLVDLALLDQHLESAGADPPPTVRAFDRCHRFAIDLESLRLEERHERCRESPIPQVLLNTINHLVLLARRPGLRVQHLARNDHLAMHGCRQVRTALEVGTELSLAAVTQDPDDSDDDQQAQCDQVRQEDPDRHLGTLGDPHDRQDHEDRQQSDGGGDLGQPIPDRANVVNRLDGRDDRGGHVGEQCQAGGNRRPGLAGGVQQGVVGTAVEWQGAHDLGIDLAEQEQHRRDDQQRER